MIRCNCCLCNQSFHSVLGPWSWRSIKVMRGVAQAIIIPGQPRAEIDFCGSHCICVSNFISGNLFELCCIKLPPLMQRVCLRVSAETAFSCF